MVIRRHVLRARLEDRGAARFCIGPDLLIIGIGAGDPDYVTMQAVDALNRIGVFFIMDKGPSKAKLIELRMEICRRYIKRNDHRFVDSTGPAWARDAEDYFSTVDGLNRDKQALFERLISEEMADGESGAFLVWGDPTLYDSTMRIIEVIANSGRHQLDYDVIPGISSVQALAAKHKTTLNRIGQSIETTTGRRIAEGFPDNADSVVVMLDAEDTYKRFADQDIDTLSTNSGSLDNLNVWLRCGCKPNAAHIRRIVVWEKPVSAAIERIEQWCPKCGKTDMASVA